MENVKTTLWMAWTGSKEWAAGLRQNRFVRGLGMLLLLALFFNPVVQFAVVVLCLWTELFGPRDLSTSGIGRRSSIRVRDDVEAAYGGVAPPSGRSH